MTRHAEMAALHLNSAVWDIQMLRGQICVRPFSPAVSLIMYAQALMHWDCLMLQSILRIACLQFITFKILQMVFANSYRGLRQGALAVPTAHNQYSLFTLERRLHRPKHLHDVTFRSAKKYCQIAQQQGFDLVEVDGFRLIYLPIDFAYAVLYKIAILAHWGTIPEYVAWPCGRFWKHFRSIFAYHSAIVVRRQG